MLNAIDRFLNSITMYRLMMWGLSLVAALAVVVGFLGKLPYAGWQLLLSAILLPVSCWVINYGLAKLLKAPATIESSVITGLILFCIMPPPDSVKNIWLPLAIAAVAMVSKYLFNIRGKHVFNPAAFAAVVFGFTQNYAASWWIANPYTVWAILVLGLMVVRKTRRFPLFFAAVVGFFISYFFSNGFQHPLMAGWSVFVSWPLLFFATIMLTEPSTLPPLEWQRVWYGLVIGLFLGSPFRLFDGIYTTPEIVLCAGNIVSFFLGLPGKITMRFESKQQLAPDAYEFAFAPSRPFQFKPGQYLEWSLPHPGQDTRGIRRYFTIASAPSDPLVRIGVRLGPKPSTFKQKLAQLEPGQSLVAGQLAGDFVLPADDGKYVFIAGGIGITPFVSMIRELMLRNQHIDVVLFYANKSADIPYLELLKDVERRYGLQVVYLEQGLIEEAMIKKYVPDFKSRMFYLSGPNAMVASYQALIRSMGIRRTRIKTDYFPGF